MRCRDNHEVAALDPTPLGWLIPGFAIPQSYAPFLIPENLPAQTDTFCLFCNGGSMIQSGKSPILMKSLKMLGEFLAWEYEA